MVDKYLGMVDMPSITLSPTSTTRPATVDATISGATGGSRYTLRLDATTVATFRVGKSGSTKTIGIAITGSTTLGDHTIGLYNSKLTMVASAILRVVTSIPVPPPTGPTIIAGPTAGSVAETTAVIAWSLSEPCTGQVEYGTTTAYGQSSTLEPNLFATHSQTLSGLTADTTYHFRSRSKNAAGVEVVSTDRSFKTQASVVVPPPTGGSYPPDSTLKVTPPNSDARPSYLQIRTDSTYGTKVIRVSDTDQWKNEYPRIQAWSKDEQYVALMWGSGRRLLNGSTYADVGRVPDGTGNQGWSNVAPHRMYGVSGHDGNIMQWEPGQSNWTVVGTIPYPDLYFGNYEGGIALNDWVALSSGTTVIVYDLANRRVVSTRNVASGLDNCDISPSGKYVVVDNGGTYLYDALTMNPIRQLKYKGMPNGFGHQDLGLDAAGNDVIVYVNPDGNGVNCQRLDTGADVYVVGGIAGVCHVSATNYERPGWCLISSNSNYPGAEGWDQVFAAKLDGSLTVEVFARMHNENPATHQQYDKSPHASFSRKGDKAIFGSVWSDSASSPTFCYVAGMSV
jgi:hypothetical protein